MFVSDWLHLISRMFVKIIVHRKILIIIIWRLSSPLEYVCSLIFIIEISMFPHLSSEKLEYTLVSIKVMCLCSHHLDECVTTEIKMFPHYNHKNECVPLSQQKSACFLTVILWSSVIEWISIFPHMSSFYISVFRHCYKRK